MTVAVPYSWLKQVPPSLLQKEEGSLGWVAPSFPWAELALQVSKALQIETLTVAQNEWQKRAEKDLLQGMGKNPAILCFELAPLAGVAWWVMAQNELDRLLSLLLTKKSESTDLIPLEYKQGVIEFLFTEIFYCFRKTDFGKGFTPALTSSVPLEKQPLYAQDLTFALDAIPFTARVIFSEELRHAWKEQSAERTVAKEISSSLAEKLSLILHLEAGRSYALSLKEWEGVRPGDFLLLEHASIDPSKDKGRVMLTLDGRPLYRARIKDGKIKILEFPLYHEVESTMVTHDDDEFDDDIDEESFAEGVSAPNREKSSATAEEAASEEEGEEKGGSSSPKGVNVRNLPLTVVIEVGRLQMSVKKLLELQPGDLLEVDLDPDNGVDLVVNGSVIGKGELLKVGDSLGVRVLDKV